jgi:ParB/RepB/Spo0J family partition protein
MVGCTISLSQRRNKPNMATQPHNVRETNVSLIPIGKLQPSSTNRKATDAAVAEMTESVRQHGILQPIIVRPLTDHSYEIVCGEVRWLSALRVKLESVPAIVRPYTDEQAQAAQIVENLQRSNPNAIDEATAYENLRKLLGKNATIEQVAVQVGKDAPYVAQRLKLLSLIPAAKKALAAGQIGIGHGILIAPLQEAQQKTCIEWLGYEEDVADVDGLYSRFRENTVQSVHSATALRVFIAKTFMLTLLNAPFDTADAKLIPKMGACTTCPHNTATAANLFPDLKDASCLLASCFFKKRDLVLEQKIAEIQKDTGKKIFRLGIGSAYFNQGPGKVKVDGYLSTNSWSSGPRYVKGEPCKSAKTAVLVFKAEAEKNIEAKIGQTATICEEADCPKHGARASSLSSGGGGRVALSGMAFVNHKEGNLKKSLPERIRWATYKALIDVLLELKEPVGGAWTERMARFGDWTSGHLGHDNDRDAVKALGLWPKDKKASQMDWGETLKKHFAGKPWAWALGNMATASIRWNQTNPKESTLYFLAQSFKVDVVKITAGLRAADKVVIDGMRTRAEERAKAAKKPKPKPKGAKVVKSGTKAKKTDKAKV